MHIVVVGAGVIGLSVADALASEGHRVTILDMRGPGRGASQASAGILAPYTEAHEGSPLLSLGTRSLELFDGFVQRVAQRSGRRIEYARTGTLEVALDADDAARLRASAAWLVSAGIAHEWLEPAALVAREPGVAAAALGGLVVPAHGFVGVMSLVTALALSARLSGATIETPVDVAAIEPARDHIRVRAGDRHYEADAVVVAAGSWTSRVKLIGLPAMPVRPMRGQLLRLDWPEATRPRGIVWGPRCYVVPWSDGSVLVGATVEDVGFDERSTADGVRTLTEAVGELLPASRHAAVADVRVGLRPVAPDGLPIIGPIAGDPRVTMASAHYRNGILLAPLTAQIVRDHIVDGNVDAATATTSPERFVSGAR